MEWDKSLIVNNEIWRISLTSNRLRTGTKIYPMGGKAANAFEWEEERDEKNSYYPLQFCCYRLHINEQGIPGKPTVLCIQHSDWLTKEFLDDVTVSFMFPAFSLVNTVMWLGSKKSTKWQLSWCRSKQGMCSGSFSHRIKSLHALSVQGMSDLFALVVN